MTAEAFHEHWRTRHAPLVVRLPDLRRYVQNTPLAPGGPPYDAIAESSFDDTQAMKALARTPEYAAVLEDEARFIDRASMASIICEEHLLNDGAPPADAPKTLRFVKRDPATPLDDFFRALLEEGHRAARAPGVLRYAQCHARRAIYDTGRTPAYDAFIMTWTERPPPAPDANTLAVTERVVL